MKKAAPFLLTLVLAACGGSGGTTDTASVADSTVATDGASPTAPSQKKMAGPVTIEVTVGTDSGKDRVEQVPLGSEVTLDITNPGADDEFHLHGYDLSAGETTKGETASLSFTADKTGEFEVESHVTGEVILVIVVS